MTRAEFETAVSEHGSKIFTLSVYLLRDAQEAEDVTQETLIRLWKRGAEVDPGKVRAWLLRVARNRCIDVIRARTARSENPVDDVAIHLDMAKDERAGPEQVARAAELRRSIGDALHELNQRSRSVVIMREIQGLSYEEIATALEMPLNSVRVTLHRARIKLRDALREEYDHAAAC